MKLEQVNISELKPMEKNVRKHSNLQIQEFAKSLNQFGQTRAFVIDEGNNILIGNGMYEAMRTSGMTSGYAYRVTGMTEKEKKKLMLSDNKIYSLGFDDFANIEEMLKDIAIDGDFDVAGFDPSTLEMLVLPVEKLADIGMQYGKIETGESDSPPMDSVDVRHGTKQPVPAGHELLGQKEEVKTVICPSCGEVIYL